MSATRTTRSYKRNKPEPIVERTSRRSTKSSGKQSSEDVQKSKEAENNKDSKTAKEELDNLKEDKIREKSTSDSKLRSTSAKTENYFTTDVCVKSLYPLLKDTKTVLDPASGPFADYPLKKALESQGIKVATADISQGIDYDFLINKPKKRYDAIVTTPTYTKAEEFLLRCVELRKPFALLIPLTVIGKSTVRQLIKDFRMSMMFPKECVFVTDDSKIAKNVPYCIWLSCGFDCKFPVVIE